MKLVYIAQYFHFPEESTGTRPYDLASSFVKKGIDVTVITSYSGEKEDSNWRYVERDGIKLYQLKIK